MPRFRKLKSGAFLEIRTGKVVSKKFVSHELSRVRFGFRGAEEFKSPKKTGREYITMKQVIDRTRELDRVDDIAALEEAGIFGLIQKLSAEGRSEEY